MPFVSEAQRRWGHSAAGQKALGGPAKVKEWDAATKEDLPARKAAPGGKPRDFHSMARKMLSFTGNGS
jgi:hypothetical protein